MRLAALTLAAGSRPRQLGGLSASLRSTEDAARASYRDASGVLNTVDRRKWASSAPAVVEPRAGNMRQCNAQIGRKQRSEVILSN